MKISDSTQIHNILNQPEVCFEAARLINSRVKIDEGPFETGEEVISKLHLDVALGAYYDDTMIGALFAREFGKKMLVGVGMDYADPLSLKSTANLMREMTNARYMQKNPLLTMWPVAKPRRPQAANGLEVGYVAVSWWFSGQGVGRLLMNQAIDIATKRSLQEIRLKQVDNSSEFYDKLGFDPALPKSDIRRLSLVA